MAFNTLDNAFFEFEVGTEQQDFSKSNSQSDNIVRELKEGTYEVTLTKILTKTSSTNKPMISACFFIDTVHDQQNQEFAGCYYWKNMVVLNSADPTDKRNRFFFNKAANFLAMINSNYGTIRNLSDIEGCVADIASKLTTEDPVYFEAKYENVGKGPKKFYDLTIVSVLN